MDKTAKVINCGPLKDDRMLCGTITVGGEFTNRIDRPQQIYNINNNGKCIYSNNMVFRVTYWST